jgi:hypothetical protein
LFCRESKKTYLEFGGAKVGKIGGIWGFTSTLISVVDNRPLKPLETDESRKGTQDILTRLPSRDGMTVRISFVEFSKIENQNKKFVTKAIQKFCNSISMFVTWPFLQQLRYKLKTTKTRYCMAAKKKSKKKAAPKKKVARKKGASKKKAAPRKKAAKKAARRAAPKKKAAPKRKAAKKAAPKKAAPKKAAPKKAAPKKAAKKAAPKKAAPKKAAPSRPAPQPAEQPATAPAGPETSGGMDSSEGNGMPSMG